jgi:hypothetical protein
MGSRAMPKALAVIFALLGAWAGQVPSGEASTGAAADGARVTLLSARPDGGAANGLSEHAVLSADGNWVAFWTLATDIAPPGESGEARVIVVERATGRVVDARVVWDGEIDTYRWPPQPSVANAQPRQVPPLAFLSVWRDPESAENRQGLFVTRDGRAERQDLDMDGVPSSGISEAPVLDGPAEWLVFQSDDASLVPWDENQATDVFARDLKAGVTYLVSSTLDGVSGAGRSTSAHLSAAGGFVAFESDADDLVEDDSNGRRDVFVQDLGSGWTERVSAPLTQDGSGRTEIWSAYYPSVDASGERMVFLAEQEAPPGQGRRGVGAYAWQDDDEGGVVRLLSAPVGGGPWRDIAAEPVISADGRWATFTSTSRALDETKTDDELDIFVADVGASFRTNEPGVATPPAPGGPAPPPLRRVSLPDLHGRQGLWIELTRYGLARGAAFGVIATERALVAADTNLVPDVYLVEWPNPGRAYLPAVTGAREARELVNGRP